MYLCSTPYARGGLLALSSLPSSMPSSMPSSLPSSMPYSSRPSSRPSLRYVESRRRLGEWGDEFEIAACAQMLNRPVEVYGRWLERKCHLCRLYRLYRFCVHSHSSSPLRLGSPLRQAFLPPGRFDLLQRMSVRNNESLLDVTLEAWEILGEAWERLWREEPDRAKLVFPFFLSPFLPF